jgi:hypothetical protein
MKIGFFGDSFCAVNQSFTEYDTYIKEIENYYNAEIVNLGFGGSSIYDLLEIQLKPYVYNNHLDVYVFVWTESMRLFHRTIRNLNSASVSMNKNTNAIINAAIEYYKYLHDVEIAHLQYVATLEYIDNNILPNLPRSSKIIHLWSFGDLPKESWNGKELDTKNIEYSHTWKHGIEVRPSLITLGMVDNKIQHITGPNHIIDRGQNQKLASVIIDIVDNYTEKQSIQNI